MFEDVFKHKILNQKEPVKVIGINKGVQASYVWNLFSVSKHNILVITGTLYEANNLYKSLCFYDESSILFYPMDDFLVGEAIAVSPDLMCKRLETLNELLNNTNKKIVITNLMGYLRFLPTKELWKKSSISLSVSTNVSKNSIVEKLDKIGYERNDLVTKTGEYANRGYILDVFPFGFEKPVRIEFFDDEIEEIRYFEPDTQLSLTNLSSLEILPFTEFINEKNVPDIPKRQSLLPRVVNKISKLSDYVENNISVFIDLESLKISYKKTMEEVLEFKQTDKFNISLYMNELDKIIPDKYVDILGTDNLLVNGIQEVYTTAEIPLFNGNYALINEYLLSLKRNRKKVVICLDNQKMINDFIANIKESCVITNITKLFDNSINVICKKLKNGFIINDTAYISSNEIYKKNEFIGYKSKLKYGSKIRDVNKLSVGDYVVHSSFGVGRYLGIVTLTSKGLKKDYIYLQYKNNDKLYIPVEKIEYISKFSSKEGVVPKLNKLGGTEWVKQKAKVKSKVKDIAKKLLEVSAKRKLLPGFSFLADDKDQYEFEEKFEFKETPDQLKAIEEIKKDMELPHPMDRLLCGDVGYGKTEVAFRAIFKAIRSGKQVSFLCPTTILSKQHYENAKERFYGFGVNIEVLNRFVTPKKKNEILKDLKNGKIDLIIGTHRLLSKDIVYKDLGLLVVDEEQRFGVTHKERIKELQKSVDVLTLSATPIPRTLQMSLSGIRGLSLIQTPPAFRYPIQTYVLRENDQIIKDAIYKELSRDGQVFILYNNVSKIDQMVSRIKKLIPEVKINYIHGQMDKKKIETTMELFVSGEYNVLICTTIIETGIDIQNANTLIVLDADCFGLSQLYQIRGRIGRGKNIGYAYLMYNKNKELNDVAKKRLDAIKEFTELGSGYALAVRDLSIRGAGDILGSEQSGFIDTVGYDMYIKILNEEVERLRGKEIPEEMNEPVDEKPFIQVSTHISSKYTNSEELKIEIHKKINTIDSYDKFIKIKNELEDRFGKLDETITIYMLEELFQVLAKKKGVIKVEQGLKQIVVYFSPFVSSKVDGSSLLAKLFKISSNFSVEYTNQVLKITLDIKNLDKHFMYYLIKMIEVIE